MPLAVWVLDYAADEMDSHRFESLILSNGRVSSIQREYIFRQDVQLKPGDRIISVDGRAFDYRWARDWLEAREDGGYVTVEFRRGDDRLETTHYIRGFSDRDRILFLYLPCLIALVFFGFSLLTPLQKRSFRKSREAVEVFSILCFSLSLFFLLFFPSSTLAMMYPFSIGTPVLSVLVLHLFLVYPNKKATARVRNLILFFSYLVAFALVALRIDYWFADHPWWFGLVDFSSFGICLIISLGALGNTIFTSKDFWARRRARLLSFLFLLVFVGVISVVMAFLWQGPRLSLERILALSVLFPVAFAMIFTRENVFDLERVFKRGMHQLLALGIAILLASLVGVSFQQWGESVQNDWLLWAAIAMVVVLFSRPVGAWAETRLNQFLNLRVGYPKVNEIFQASKGLEDFLTNFSQYCEEHLNMQDICYRFYKDPTNPWSKDNEQVWLFKNGKLQRVYDSRQSCYYFSLLKRDRINVGEISFSGGDALAFDPVTSTNWHTVCASLAQCLELSILRDYLVSQQGLLAVGRMQALLAHEMKNPLAVIKVCSGLLQSHTDGSEEGEEILKTIQQEVERVSLGVQNIFNHSGRDEKKEKVDVYQLVEKVRESAKARFPDRNVSVRLFVDRQEEPWEPGALWMWTQREGLRQSLVNLIVNAFEAGSPTASVEIYLRSRRHLRIVVRDKGPGIPKEVELFKPFISTKANGTGLGLSHVKAFVDRHSGRIQVNSQPARGTSFTLEFSPDFVVK